MNIPFTRVEFDMLPFREDVEFFVAGQQYRSRHWAKSIFVYHGPDARPTWDRYIVDFEPPLQWGYDGISVGRS